MKKIITVLALLGLLVGSVFAEVIHIKVDPYARSSTNIVYQKEIKRLEQEKHKFSVINKVVYCQKDQYLYPATEEQIAEYEKICKDLRIYTVKVQQYKDECKWNKIKSNEKWYQIYLLKTGQIEMTDEEKRYERHMEIMNNGRK